MYTVLASLNQNKKQMTLTIASVFTFKSMKGPLKRVFGSENVEKDLQFLS